MKHSSAGHFLWFTFRLFSHLFKKPNMVIESNLECEKTLFELNKKCWIFADRNVFSRTKDLQTIRMKITRQIKTLLVPGRQELNLKTRIKQTTNKNIFYLQEDKSTLSKYKEAVEKRLHILEEQGYVYAYETISNWGVFVFACIYMYLHVRLDAYETISNWAVHVLVVNQIRLCIGSHLKLRGPPQQLCF